MAMSFFSPRGSRDPAPDAQTFWNWMGPQAVDQSLRQAISMCWMMLPKEKKTVAGVEEVMRRVVDRAVADFNEDAATFVLPQFPPGTAEPRNRAEEEQHTAANCAVSVVDGCDNAWLDVTEGDSTKGSLDMFGPQMVDTSVRAAISTCWMMLPPDKKNAETVAAKICKLVDRALASLREDAAAFGT